MSEGTPVAIAVVGARGRLGRLAVDVFRAARGFELVAEVGSSDDLVATLRRSRARVALDVTRAGLGYAHAAAMLGAGVRPVVGTSGVGPDENRALDAQARELGLGGIVVPNFSLGMWVLQRAAVEAARRFPAAEIVELHHERKKDAPSGTALDTAERMRAARGGGPEVPIHSVRMPGLYAHQVVLFGAPGETLTLRHDMSGPEAFAPGLLAAARYASTAVGVARGIGAAFEATGGT